MLNIADCRIPRTSNEWLLVSLPRQLALSEMHRQEREALVLALEYKAQDIVRTEESHRPLRISRLLKAGP